MSRHLQSWWGLVAFVFELWILKIFLFSDVTLVTVPLIHVENTTGFPGTNTGSWVSRESV